MKWLKFFFCLTVALILCAFGVIALVKTQGSPVSLILGILGIGSGIYCFGKGVSIALKSYDAMEESLHGKPKKSILIWLFWFIVLAGGLVLLGLFFSK